MNRLASLLFGVATVPALVLSRPVASQCPQQWLPGDQIPFAHGAVRATTVWDPDGAGPAPAVLVAGGRFGAGSMLSTAIASFDGTDWASLGTPPMPEVRALTTWNGLLVAAGGIGLQATVATWNGTTWSTVGTTNGRINSMTVFNGDLVIGGGFAFVNGQPAASIARWNGTTWSEPGGGVVGEVLTMTVFGSLYVGGLIAQAGPALVNNLAIWSGTAWSAGASFNAAIRSLAARSGLTAATSFLFAGGDFTSVGGVAAQHVARFSASTGAWTAIPGLPGTMCRVVHVRSTGTTTFQLHAAVVDVSSSQKVFRLNGTTWSPLVGGVFSPMVARWNGNAWLAQSTTTSAWDFDVLSLVALPNGDYIGGGLTSFFGLGGIFGGADANLARHRGGGSSLTWEAFDLLGEFVAASTLLPNGDAVFVGDFDGAGGLANHNLAVLRPTCPAAAVPHGTGCTGSGGANVLTATAPPWTGSTFRALATGMPTNAIALAVTGFSPLSVPMPAVLPQGVAGCTLLFSPDLIDATLPVAGTAATQLVLPDTVALGGQVFYHQVVPLEFDLAGNIVALTGTNGLTLTIGVL